MKAVGFRNTDISGRQKRSCPVVVPLFSFAFGRDVLSRTHRIALNLKGKGRAERFIGAIWFSVIWPVLAFGFALEGALRVNRERWGVDASRFSLFLVFWTLMVRHNVSVESCLEFQLWKKKNQTRLQQFIQHKELIGLLEAINRGKNTEALNNKLVFAALCKRHHLPHAEIVASVKDCRVSMNDQGYLPKRNLFSKMNGTWGGSGGQKWTFDADRNIWRSGDSEFDEVGLIEHFKVMSKSGDVVVQLNLENGKGMRELSSGALCTFRVVTTKLPSQTSKHLRSSLRMPTGQNDVDNFGAGGLGAAVTDNGSLTQAIKKLEPGQIYLTHPDTGTRIAGTHLSFNDEVIALARRAHDAITDVYTVGWDIAWTEYGAVIIEANTCWGQDILQMPNGDPLGEDFCEFYLTAKADLDTQSLR